MKTRTLIGLLVLLTLTVSACSTTPPAAPTVMLEPASPPAEGLPQTEAQVPRVTVEEAKAALDNGTAVIVDVRILESFVAQHIQGALSIPLTGIEADPAGVKLDKDKWIITYCT